MIRALTSSGIVLASTLLWWFNAGSSGAMGYADSVLSDDPVIYYRLGESSGTVATDLGSAGNDGTYAGSPTLGIAGISGDGNTAVSFDGTNDTLEPSTPYSPTITNLTQEAWIKTANPMPDALSTIFSWQNSGAAGGLAFAIGTAPAVGAPGQGKLWCGWTEPFVVEIAYSLARIDDGNWHHVACVWDGTSGVEFDGSQISIYIDGALDTNGEASFGNKGSTAPYATDFVMLASTDAAAWDSFTDIDVDEPAIYEEALSSARLLAHFNAGSP